MKNYNSKREELEEEDQGEDERNVKKRMERQNVRIEEVKDQILNPRK